MSLRLYPKVKVKRQSFIGAKKFVLPSQSMTLREIILRFTRRESLPVEKQGVYHEGLGDLEKAQNEDITVRMERVSQLRSAIKKAEQKAADDEAAKKALESAPPAPAPSGAVTGSAGSAQAPAPS